jgi:hypothetical protein
MRRVLKVAVANPTATAAVSTRATKDLFHGSRKRRDAQRDRACPRNRQRQLAIRGEIERDAGAELHGHPGQQPAGARLGPNPAFQLGSKRAGTSLRCPAWRPSARNSPGNPLQRPAPWPVPLRHAATSRAMLAQDAADRQNGTRTGFGLCPETVGRNGSRVSGFT